MFTLDIWQWLNGMQPPSIDLTAPCLIAPLWSRENLCLYPEDLMIHSGMPSDLHQASCALNFRKKKLLIWSLLCWNSFISSREVMGSNLLVKRDTWPDRCLHSLPLQWIQSFTLGNIYSLCGDSLKSLRGLVLILKLPHLQFYT